MTHRLPVVAVTPGEPAGIGPDLAVSVAKQSFAAAIVAIGDADMLSERAQRLGISLEVVALTDRPSQHRPGRLLVHHVPLAEPVECGQPDSRNAASLLQCLDEAVSGCLAGRWDAMVTGPLHKAVINEAGVPFTGHTEYIAGLTGTDLPVMMLAAGDLRVALATTHLPLSAVPAAITRDRLVHTMEILDRDLRGRFAIDRPRILVCGLNPHAGEGGHLGHEEIDVIGPAVSEATARGIQVVGPLPADTAFTPDRLSTSDAVLAMYHDQGLPVLKYAGFGKAVNVTLGLPIIRTSVDHGTALDIAGRGSADPGSLIAAMEMAIRMADAARP